MYLQASYTSYAERTVRTVYPEDLRDTQMSLLDVYAYITALEWIGGSGGKD
jgi:hypothetical protein